MDEACFCLNKKAKDFYDQTLSFSPGAGGSSDGFAIPPDGNSVMADLNMLINVLDFQTKDCNFIIRTFKTLN